ncbi:MAG: AarF/ABC1/UbiB kinase family protein [Myxococcota bacterium]|nr:AarF/ABC1/UbiB kinase family protein [Myxococcota bacterium]
MKEKKEPQRQAFLDELRAPSERGLGRGLGRLARTARGALGLTRGVLSASAKGEDWTLDDKDLKSIEALVMRLGKLKGLPMKMGQIMSYLELEMPPETRRVLSLLQTQSAATPWPLIETSIREDLGDKAERLLAALDHTPVAVASIGQVHRGQLPGGASVAVKVRHPDIEEAIRSDFAAAEAGTGLAGFLLPGVGATARDFVGETRTRLLEECDYRLEADRQVVFSRLFSGHPTIVVPEVHLDWCSRRVLVTAWEKGREFEDFRASANQAQRDSAGAALFDFYIGTLYRHGLFHADPHPGNYHLRDDGRIAVFDYGCVCKLEPSVVQAFVHLAAAVRDDDRAKVCEALREIGGEPSSNDATYAQLRRLLRGFFEPMLRDGPHAIDGRIRVEMAQVARDKLAIARLRLPGHLVFLLRIRFGLYAVLSRLGAVCDWSAMERGFAEDSGRSLGLSP